uniref:C2 domain-containing protein n=1 Tax=Amorphochlora amoebiformis TaxID=1561963 RepID=A0A7S0CWA6_9EUKA|mmetsp:Transcript_14699/g.23252  ORF Transcript_14699/g.23252 Transcript_14699/m.23252 type:complete len:537 (+) Transcript_14699:81-1691(+)
MKKSKGDGGVRAVRSNEDQNIFISRLMDGIMENDTVDSNVFCTTKRHPSADPVWNYTIDLQMAMCEGDILHLCVTKAKAQDSRVSKPVALGAFILDDIKQDELTIKPLVIADKKMRARSSQQLVMESKQLDPSKSPIITFKIIKHVKKSAKIYFVRHGESKWNQARREKNYRKLIHFDHVLTLKGIRQSINLKEFWTHLLKDNSMDPELQNFLNADMVLSSPLTRALQTCLLSLEGHPTVKEKGVTLCRHLREIKSLGGFDAKGKCYGPAIMERVEEKLKKKVKEGLSAEGVRLEEIKEQVEKMSAVCKTKVDYNDANSQWWVFKDTPSSVKERLEDFLSYIRYLDGDTFICVGHSMFLKALFTHCLSQDWTAKNPETAENLKKEKLTNAGCVAAELVFRSRSKGSEREDCEIVDVKLIFETGFQFRKSKSSSLASPRGASPHAISVGIPRGESKSRSAVSSPTHSKASRAFREIFSRSAHNFPRPSSGSLNKKLQKTHPSSAEKDSMPRSVKKNTFVPKRLEKSSSEPLQDVKKS